VSKEHYGILWETISQFAVRKSLFEKTFCAPCTPASVERAFNNGGYLLGHTDASKAQCIDFRKNESDPGWRPRNRPTTVPVWAQNSSLQTRLHRTFTPENYWGVNLLTYLLTPLPGLSCWISSLYVEWYEHTYVHNGTLQILCPRVSQGLRQFAHEQWTERQVASASCSCWMRRLQQLGTNHEQSPAALDFVIALLSADATHRWLERLKFNEQHACSIHTTNPN